MPKLFFAIVPSETQLNTLQSVVIPFLEKHSHEWRISNPLHWHITLHFIGIVSEKAQERIIREFERAIIPPLGTIQVGGQSSVGIVGGRVLFIPVHVNEEKWNAARQKVREIAPVLGREKQHPHLTIARSRKRKGVSKNALLEGFPLVDFRYFPDALILFRSEQKDGKTLHIPLVRRIFPRLKGEH